MEDPMKYGVLESLVKLFDHTLDEEQKNEVFEQWKDWTLDQIYTYYMVEEQNNKVLEIKEVPMKNTLQIKTGQFEF